MQSSAKYQLSSRNELNPSDFLTPGGIKQIAETYTGQGVTYHVRIMQFSNEQEAIEGISILEEQYNPAMIGLSGKYVKYKEASPTSHMYYYKSGKNIIFVDFTGDKDSGDNFIIWYYSKYANK